MAGVTESLAGRVAVIELHSLSVAELEAWSGRTAEGKQLLEWIHTGGYPEIHAKELDPERFFSDYLANLSGTRCSLGPAGEEPARL